MQQLSREVLSVVFEHLSSLYLPQMMLVCKEWKEVLTVEFLWREAAFTMKEPGATSYTPIATCLESFRTSLIRSRYSIKSFTLRAALSEAQSLSFVSGLSLCKDWLTTVNADMSYPSTQVDLFPIFKSFPKLQHLDLTGITRNGIVKVSPGHLSLLSIRGRWTEEWAEEDLEWLSELRFLDYTPHSKPNNAISDLLFQIVQRCSSTLTCWTLEGYGPFRPIDATLNLPALKSIRFNKLPQNAEFLETMQMPNLKEAGGQVGTLLHLPPSNLQALKIHFEGTETSGDLIKLVGLHQSSLTYLSLINNWHPDFSSLIDPLFQFLKPDLLQGIKCPNLSHLSFINSRFYGKAEITREVISLLAEVLQARCLAVKKLVSLEDDQGNSLYQCSKLTVFLPSKEMLEEFRALESEAITKIPSGLREVIGKVEVESLGYQ